MRSILHIGMPKAASSSLQVGLFSQSSHHAYLGLYPMGNVAEPVSRQAPEGLAFSNDPDLQAFWKDLHHRPDTPNLLTRFEAIAERWNPQGLPLLMSHEALTSCLFSAPNLEAKARAAAQVFGDIDILLVCREPLGWLKSQYRDHPFDPRALITGPAISFDAWVQILLGDLPGFPQMLRPGSLEAMWRRHFPSVIVVDFTGLVAQVPNTVAQLAALLDQPPEMVAAQLAGTYENRGLSDADVRARRRIRGFGPYEEPDDPDLFALGPVSRALIADLVEHI